MSEQGRNRAIDTEEWIRRRAEEIAAAGRSAPRQARDPVNTAMINNWTEAFSDTDPRYAPGPDTVAPPGMIQAWTMAGLHGARATDDPLGHIIAVLDEAGYTSIVATNSDQTYHRYLRVGERVSSATELTEVVGPKRTALGEGWFVTTKTVWTVGDEQVGEMRFRVLKFRPGSAETGEEPESHPDIIDARERSAGTMRPPVSKDTEFFWEGTKQAELRIQRFGTELRHPPGAMGREQPDAEPDWIRSTGKGTVYSYVVHHHPKVPGRATPFVVALVDLEEGVRMMGELIDVDPETVHIGQQVEVVFLRVTDDLVLPAWRPRS
ncbi:bifunctional MaoC family dehydratase N-terminal/OB-fold nucleic acid binding domain-containing protein [Sciscionella sediminilitoris]|uniref:bifunctional MaoC family dehydratase N-terminal/OB-fold nucleic acid binding domain-containing protein n=1 Tax=Sciscionella sediminilitoris TaxID=1445613 RepID=UPI00068F2847|nr:OB-fold domain-containing protein [Sciscionella sp. SE31]